MNFDLPYEQAVDAVRSALKEQGFGVLTEIDVKATMYEKLGIDFEPYTILGACNPPLAHQALEADRTIGLLLPCNVVVRASSSGSRVVQAIAPEVMTTMTDLEALRAVAAEAATRIRAVLESPRPA